MMRKRILAALLALMMVSSLMTATVAAAEPDTANNTTAEAAADSGAQTSTADGGAQTADSTSSDGKDETAEAAKPEIPADPEGTLSFANIESRVRANNITIKMLDEQIASIDAIDFDQQIDGLRDSMNGIAKAIYGMNVTGMSMLSSSMQSSYESLKAQFDDLRDGNVQHSVS